MIQKKIIFVYKNNKVKIFLSLNKFLFYLREVFIFLFIFCCLFEVSGYSVLIEKFLGNEVK